MKKTIIILAILIILLFSTTVLATTPLFFSDVPTNNWFTNSVSFVQEKGLMIGNNNQFRPNDYLTRAEAASIIQRIYEDLDNRNINMLAKILPNCVQIDNDTSAGSGVILQNGYIISANHVSPDSDKVKIILDGQSFDGTIYKRSVDDDLCLIIYNPEYTDVLPISIVDSIKNGQEIYAISSPLSYTFSITKGVISKTESIVKNIPYIQFDAIVSKGSSGGGIFNESGNLVGIIVSKADVGINFAVHYDKIQKFIKNVLDLK